MAPRKKARKTVQRRRKSPARKKAGANNAKAHWAAFHQLQKQVDKAWTKFRASVKKRAAPQIQMRNRNELMLLLGECSYMVRSLKKRT